MDIELQELSRLIDSLFEFYSKLSNEILNQDQLKESNSIRSKIKKKMTSIYESYQPSTGGFALGVYRFIFSDNDEVGQFAKITEFSKFYKKHNIEQLDSNSFRITLISTIL